MSTNDKNVSDDGHDEDELQRINVMLPKWLLDKVKAEASGQTLSTSTYIRVLLIQHFKNGDGEQSK